MSGSNAANGKMAAAVSVDLDDTWAYLRSFGRPDWRDHGSILPLALTRALELLRTLDLRVTFFAVGRDAEHPVVAELLRQAVVAGHEVANHSYEHDLLLHERDIAAVGADLASSSEVIRRASGQSCYGFRGPGYGLSPALARSLHQAGYRYDASVFSSSLARLAQGY